MLRYAGQFQSVFNAIVDGPKFKREGVPRTAFDVVGWWESRRFFYNIVVGCTGMASCLLIAIWVLVSETTVGEPIGLPDGPLLGIFGVIMYGILANICYTAGWLSELIVRSVSTSERSAAYALKTFRLGVQFSVLLTVLPAAICWIVFVVALITGHKSQANPE